MVPACAARHLEQVSVAADDDRKRTGQRIRDLLAAYSIEVIPATVTKHACLADLLPADTRVYVAYVPGADHREV
ncbi:MAG: hypothetical protein ACREIR_03725, partial [Geminicoccaceae bacterium]